MKMALVTVHKANNYGALLQAYALQQVLSRFGQVNLVDYDNEYLSRSLDPIRIVFSFHGFLGFGKDICRLFPRYRLIKKFKKFISERFVMTATYSQDEILHNKLPGYDCYVVGSDQVWNSACVSRRTVLDPVYFLQFAPKGAKKVSYASSMGGYMFSEKECIVVAQYLKSFSAISVREENTQNYLKGLIPNKVDHVLDPTLLLDKSQWRKLIDHNFSGDKYILLYTVPKVRLVRNAVDYFSNKMGLKVIAIDQGLMAGARVDKQLRDVGPEEFLTLFANADFVVTDSFHGVCFSIIFERPFIALSPGLHSNRVESLLSLVGLSDRYVQNELDFSNISSEVDFSESRIRLEQAREASIKFLNQALESI